MQILSAALAAVVAGTLLWAGLAKLQSQGAFRRTLEALGVAPSLPGRVVAAVLPVTEICVAIGLTLYPSAQWPNVGVATLATAFAAAGLLGLRAAQPVECSCLGFTARGTLGRRQVYALPAWLAAAATLAWLPPPWSPASGAYALTGITIAMAGAQAIVVERKRRHARDDRQAFAGGTGNPPPMFAVSEVAG